MILPSSYAFTLAVVVLGMLCWGLWASLYKAAGKLRFELFCFDFAIGLPIAALLAAFTFGSLGFDGFSFMDDVLNAAKKQDIFAIIAGGIFCLGNMLLLAAVAEAGLAVAFPISVGVAVVLGSTINFFMKPGQNIVLILAGITVIVVAVILSIVAYRIFELGRADELVRTGQLKTTRRTANAKGAVLAVLAGVILGSYMPLISKAMEGEVGLGPYSTVVMFSIGAFLATFFYNLFFMNLPVSGAPLEVVEYFKVPIRQHILGLLAGGMWLAGLLASLVAAAVDSKLSVGPAVGYGLSQGSVVIAAASGLLIWKELTNKDGRTRALMLVTIALFVCGLGLIALGSVNRA